ncbi:MAG: hypothetical protein ACRCZB_03740 [Bacteroidales bacterium]
MSKIKTELGNLIDCPEEEFIEFTVGKDLGYLTSFNNLLIQTYNEVLEIKRDLMSKYQSGEVDITEETFKEHMQGLFAKLLRLEHRIFLLKGIIKGRAIQGVAN